MLLALRTIQAIEHSHQASQPGQARPELGSLYRGPSSSSGTSNLANATSHSLTKAGISYCPLVTGKVMPLLRGPIEWQQCACIPVMSGLLSGAGEACSYWQGKGVTCSAENPKAMWNADSTAQLLFPSHCFLHICFLLLTQSCLLLSPLASQAPWSTRRPH